MMGHNICFKGVIWKIIPKLSHLPLLIWSTDEIKGAKERLLNTSHGIYVYILAHLNKYTGRAIAKPPALVLVLAVVLAKCYLH